MTLRELDAVLAERVMGLECAEGGWPGNPFYAWQPRGLPRPVFGWTSRDAGLPFYTDSYRDSAVLREKAAERFCYVRVDICRRRGEMWNQCRIWNPEEVDKGFTAEAKTDRLAVALCVAKAYGIEVKELEI